MSKLNVAIFASLAAVTVEYGSASRGRRVDKVEEVTNFRNSIYSEIDKIHDTKDRQEQLLYLLEYMENKKREPYFSTVVKPYCQLKVSDIGGTTLLGNILKASEEEYQKVIRTLWTSTAPYMRTNLQKEIIRMYLVRRPDGLKGSITAKEKAELYG